MKLCRVIGNVYGEVKHPDYVGRKLLIVRPVDENDRPAGKSYLAVDAARAGVGDLVLVLTEGTGVRQILGVEKAAIRSLVVGVVDAVTVEGAGGA